MLFRRVLKDNVSCPGDFAWSRSIPTEFVPDVELALHRGAAKLDVLRILGTLESKLVLFIDEV